MIERKRFVLVLSVATTAALAQGCAAQRNVVFYPNAHYEKVGTSAAQRDYRECLAAAEAAGTEGSGAEKAGRRAAKGAAVGGAVGAAHGAVRGRDVVKSAGAGAAAGAAGGAVSTMFDDKPDALTRRFVEQCLREKGYRPVGWR